MNVKTITIIALIVSTIGNGFCQTRKITLDEAVGIALKENYEIKSRSHDVKARQWGLRNAVSQFLPRVTFNTAVTRLDETTRFNQNSQIAFLRELVPNPDDIPFVPRESFTSELIVTMPLYNGGALWANLSAAKNSRNASRYGYSEAELTTILETKRAFFNVLRAEDILDVWQRSVELAEMYLKSAKLRQTLGMVSTVEVLRWKLQVAENKTSLTQAENDASLSRISFAKILGVGLSTEFELVHLSDAEVQAVIDGARPDLETNTAQLEREWQRRALANSPALLSFRASTAVHRAAYRRTYSLFQPSLNFNYTHSWATDDDIRLDGLETWRASIMISFPLFSSFGDYSSLQEAREDLKSSEAEERDFERTLMLQVSSQAAILRAALRHTDAAALSRDLARENADVVQNKFENGLVDNLNLIDAQIALTAAEARYVSAIYDFLIAQAEIDKLLGGRSD